MIIREKEEIVIMGCFCLGRITCDISVPRVWY